MIPGQGTKIPHVAQGCQKKFLKKGKKRKTFTKHLLHAGCREHSSSEDAPCPHLLETHSREEGKSAPSGPLPPTPSPQSPELCLCFIRATCSTVTILVSSPQPSPAFFVLVRLEGYNVPPGKSQEGMSALFSAHPQHLGQCQPQGSRVLSKGTQSRRSMNT